MYHTTIIATTLLQFDVDNSKKHQDKINNNHKTNVGSKLVNINTEMVIYNGNVTITTVMTYEKEEPTDFNYDDRTELPFIDNN